MLPIIHSGAYEYWAPMVARWFLALQFSVAAFFKITGFSMQAGAAAAVGLPFPTLAVVLGLILEVAGVDRNKAEDTPEGEVAIEGEAAHE